MSELQKHEGYLLHWQQKQRWIFLTWRLADALPQSKIRALKAEKEAWVKAHPKPWDEAQSAHYYQKFATRMEQYLDQGLGSCLLRNPNNAKIVGEAFDHFHEERYTMGTYVVMPNHVHLLFRLHDAYALEDLVHSWKRFTARKINQESGRTGSLWQREYWDRVIRSEQHFFHVVKYIKNNPEKAGLREGQFLLNPYKRRNNQAFV